MFVIENAPVPGVHGDPFWVVDQEREVWLQRVSGYAMAIAVSFQLNVKGRVFLYEAEQQQQSDGHYQWAIVEEGFSPVATMWTGIRSETFSSDRERHAIGLLAAEALLVYGNLYDGNPDPALNDHSVVFEGRTYRLQDLASTSADRD